MPDRAGSFDPKRSFYVLRGFRLYGVDYAPGQSFDRNLITTRQLRQLYENRQLEMSDKPSPEDQAMGSYVEGRITPFALMTGSELTTYLTKNGVVSRSSWSRARLQERAERLLMEKAHSVVVS